MRTGDGAGNEVRVWAPHATRVDVIGPSGRGPLEPDGGGWFRGTNPFEDYSFSLDGAHPRPDPRSQWQPHGVHGPSRVVDHGAFEWGDHAWTGFPLSSAVIYELHAGTFTHEGTFEAAIEKLDHLISLGINVVELMPVNQFPGTRGWGYDGVCIYAPHDGYGGPEGLKRLVDACHARGLAVVLDVVYNHLGPGGDHLSEFGPYFTERYGTPWGKAVNLDGPGSPEVRAFFIDNACNWLEQYHVDGLRLDAIQTIYDMSATHFLEEMADRVASLAARLGRTLWLIAESDLNDPRVIRARDAGGYGLDAQWNDDFHHSLHALMTGERSGYYTDFGTVADVATALRQAFVYDGKLSRFRGRHHGRSTEGSSGHRFLGYLQNHDQVGNRAGGDRISSLVSHDLMRVGAALVMTSPFVPLLFQGEEWGATTPFLYFTDHEDPELGRAVSQGRRREFATFGWDLAVIADPQDESTFLRSKLDWSELDEQPHADLLDWYRRLIQLRQEVPALTDGRMDRLVTTYSESPPWLVVARGDMTVACNFAPAPVDVPVRTGGAELLLTSAKDPAPRGEQLRLPPESVTLFARRRTN